MNHHKKTVLTVLCLFTFTLSFSTPRAFAVFYTFGGAQNSEQVVVTGDTVTVDDGGAVNGQEFQDGVGGHDADNVTVVVHSGGQITSLGGDDNILVDGSGHNAIELRDGANITIDQGGTVSNAGYDSTGAGFPHNSAIVVGDNAVMDIAGTVDVTRIQPPGNYNNWSPTISADDNANITIQSTGVVSNSVLFGQAVELGQNSTLNNAGTITSTLLTNADRGVVATLESGVTIINTGSIINGSPSTDSAIRSVNSVTINNNGGTITGNITHDTAGAVVLTNSGTITGDIDLGNVTGNTFTQTGGTITGNVDLGNGATHTVTLTSGQISGLLDIGDAAGTAVTVNPGAGVTMTLSNSGGTALRGEQTTLTKSGAGTLQITGNIVDSVGGDNDLTLAVNAGTVSFGETSSIDGGLDVNGGTVSLGSSAVTVKSATDFAAGTTLALSIGSTSGVLSNGASDVAITINDGVIISAATGAISNGATYVVVNGTGAGGGANLTATAANLTLNMSGAATTRYSFGLLTSGDQLLIAATAKNLSSTLPSEQNNVNNQLDAGLQNDPELLNAINGLGTSDLQNTLQGLQPVNDHAAQLASTILQDDVINNVENHISNSDNEENTGVASGDCCAKDFGIWAQGFYSYANQDNRGGALGFDANTAGFAVGADRKTTDDDKSFLMGFAYSKAWAGVNMNNSPNETDIDSHQFTPYFSFEKAHTFLNLIPSYALNFYDSKRYISAGAVNRKAKGEYIGNQFSVKTEVGHHFERNKWKLTPSIGLQYSALHTGDYTETGAGGANLSVQSNTFHKLDGLTALTVSRKFHKKKYTWEPEVSTGFSYDFLNDKVSTSSSFAGGGASFSTAGVDPRNYLINFGAGVRVARGEGWEALIRYDFDFNQDYYRHNGILNIRYDF